MKLSNVQRERLTQAGIAAVTVFIIAPGLAGVGLFGWQVFRWLEAGYWHSVSVRDAMVWAGIGAEWAQSPSSWLGAWRIATWVPAAAAGVIVSFALGWFVSAVIEEGSR